MSPMPDKPPLLASTEISDRLMHVETMLYDFQNDHDYLNQVYGEHEEKITALQNTLAALAENHAAASERQPRPVISEIDYSKEVPKEPCTPQTKAGPHSNMFQQTVASAPGATASNVGLNMF